MGPNYIKTIEAPCTYCGVPWADTLDHVIPHCYTAQRKMRRKYNRRDCVPACAECNMALASIALFTIGDRASFLADNIYRRYRKLLRTAQWKPEEIDGIDRMLADYITGSLSLVDLTKNRIHHCKSVALECPTSDEVWARIDDLEAAA